MDCEDVITVAVQVGENLHELVFGIGVEWEYVMHAVAEISKGDLSSVVCIKLLEAL